MSSQAYRLHQNGDMSGGASMCGYWHTGYAEQVKSASCIISDTFHSLNWEQVSLELLLMTNNRFRVMQKAISS